MPTVGYDTINYYLTNCTNHVLYSIMCCTYYTCHECTSWLVSDSFLQPCIVYVCTCNIVVTYNVVLLINRKPLYKHYKTMKRIQHISRDSWFIIVVRIYMISYILIFWRNYKCISSFSERLRKQKRFFIEKYLFRVIIIFLSFTFLVI